MVVKHPKSQEAPRVYSFEDYYDPTDSDDCESDVNSPISADENSASKANNTSESDTPNPNNSEAHDRLPWRPFRSRLDFELAEHMQGTNLNKGEIEALLGIINRIIETPHQFTITNFADLTKAWTLARNINIATGVISLIYVDSDVNLD